MWFKTFVNLESIASLAISTSSKICLPSTKVFSELETMDYPTTFFNLFAKTLARHLYKPLTKLIGLKYFKSSAHPFLGINIKMVAFKLSFKRSLVIEFLKKHPSCFKKSQHCCHNIIVKPSLGFLSPLFTWRVARTSSNRTSQDLALPLFKFPNNIPLILGLQSP